MNQQETPLFTKLQQFASGNPLSFHVPGHKNGQVFPEHGATCYSPLLKLDMTELPELDDLHAPKGVIAQAQQLAKQFFQSEETFFLVGGSTSGNLAMILATCKADDYVIVQRNCHKSIMNGLELAGAKPVFLAPEFDERTNRYACPSYETMEKAIRKYPEAKAVIVTYPDYFGQTFPLKKMIELAHRHEIPVLVDEAHGVHFSLGKPFPPSALTLGADIVVQSAHKMAPAMTMSAYLHVNSKFVSKEKVAHYLQMIQSSSPSYPLMASLDLARYYLANFSERDMDALLKSVKRVRHILSESTYWDVLPQTETDDPLKITLQAKEGWPVKDIAEIFAQKGIYPELTTDKQILFIHGLRPFPDLDRLKKAVESAGDYLKNRKIHATIKATKLFAEPIQELALSYAKMNVYTYDSVPLEEGVGQIAAEAIIPYPPGIPLVIKGEVIKEEHIRVIKQLEAEGVSFQQRHRGVKIFK
ncbi:lysine decarboxylase [Compostibacillus humi]|uniref:Lysine decarboxylase n=1 Tax=Compostibacillus humi TaxID=1245525 RepID=A0A8J2X978_9BACI|nr:aminotransferase class I/II-fold pyridoxal phosphate-dependent enzyme [Compostibacillus humi]GFZ79207.1 lysine decarboxylase [Compostibacillus humi]